MSVEEFIRRSIEAHPGEHYDYSRVEYINEDTPVIIGCPVHGWFKQLPVNHIRGAKCPDCQTERIAKERRKTQNEFIQQAIEMHGNTYDYSKVNYIDNNTPVTIICPEHGKFEQLPSVHLAGHGCSRCTRSSNGEKRIRVILERYNVKYKDYYKIKNLSVISTNKRFFVDFYLKDYNLVIEYNGSQHYTMSTRFGGDKNFKRQQARDEALRVTLKEMKINLLEIPYTEFKNLEKILVKELKLVSQ